MVRMGVAAKEEEESRGEDGEREERERREDKLNRYQMQTKRSPFLQHAHAPLREQPFPLRDEGFFPTMAALAA